MSDRDEQASVERVERAVRDLLRGRSPRIEPGDAGDRDAILAAVRLAGGREPFPRMAPSFRRRLAERLGVETASSAVSRRVALVAGLAAAVGLAGGAAIGRGGLVGGALPGAAHAGPTLRPPLAPPETVQPLAAAARWFPAGPLASLPDGQGVLFKAGSVSAYLFRSGAEVRALSAICTHLPCELAWQRENHQLMCPCHQRAFDAQGESIAAGDYQYALPPLPRVMVRVTNDGMVEVLGA